jgi:hypothetical protein
MMTVERKRTRPPALYWDVAKIVWDYLIETVDDAILYEYPLRAFQIEACEYVIQSSMKPLHLYLWDHVLMTQMWGCDRVCVLIPCGLCRARRRNTILFASNSRDLFYFRNGSNYPSRIFRKMIHEWLFIRDLSTLYV